MVIRMASYAFQKDPPSVKAMIVIRAGVVMTLALVGGWVVKLTPFWLANLCLKLFFPLWKDVLGEILY